VHEKELLAIIRALGKWRTDLLGYNFEVWTDHKTLEHFGTQRDLSRRQARWMEFLSQYDATIHYLPGERNTVADALSRLPDPDTNIIAMIFAKSQNRKIRSRFELEDAILDEIKTGYATDAFAQKLISAATGMPNVENKHGFWFVDERLVIPNGRNVRETLFRIAHDKLGHFGTTKTYDALRDSFYWPNMRRDLEQAYIPSCADCQRNKSSTTKPMGPLHPLPVPDRRCDSVAIDFIGPLPLDGTFDCIATFTDRLGSDVRIVPTSTTLTAEGLAELFFKEWYCENGLPLEIVSDRDKLFLSRFWRTLHKLTGVKLKMSTAYHPQTDGASERTNKTVIQCIRFAVERDQRGWAATLPKVRFDIMNTINASTGYSPFQMRFGKSPRLLPPLIPNNETAEDEPNARALIERMTHIERNAQDNLLTAKVKQAFHANKERTLTFPFRVGDRVVLTTLHRRREYKSGDHPRAAKFMPRYDGPYAITATDEAHSTVTLDIPHKPNLFPVFHTSEVHPFKENDDDLFPLRALHPPPPLTIDNHQEFFIDKIVDERRKGRGHQYLVRWRGEGPEGDKWLPASELEDCEALDRWQTRTSPAHEHDQRLTIRIPARA
jgi:transposase InsO family protein